MTGQQFSPATLVSSTNETDHHYILEILLKGGVKTLVTKPLLYIIMNLCLKLKM
jgi:hypothetical protein